MHINTWWLVEQLLQQLLQQEKLAALSPEADMALECCCGASSATLSDAEWLEPGMTALCEAGTGDGAGSVPASVSAAPSAHKSAACLETW